LKADVSSDTILASQKQMAQIFEVTPKNITIHLKQIFVDKELEEKQVAFSSSSLSTNICFKCMVMFFGVTSKICAICFCDAKMVSELTSA
jgi:predicted methyltransferase MtxX (methanogen marker protein 4)